MFAFAALAVGVFAIWTFGYHSRDAGTDDGARALAMAEEFAQGLPSSARLADVVRIAPGLWRARYKPGAIKETQTCFAIDLTEFRSSIASSWAFTGVGEVPC